jgi:hypothetical protein
LATEKAALQAKLDKANTDKEATKSDKVKGKLEAEITEYTKQMTKLAGREAVFTA